MAPRLSAGIARAAKEGRPPLAVVDVDLTIIDNAPRTRAIFSDWLHTIRDRWEPAAEKSIEALTMPIVFGVFDNLATLGVTDPELQRDGLRFWLEAFFSSEYCRRDVALPGAVGAIGELRRHGVTVVYLTARTAGMAEGTVATFAKLGFPVAVPGTLLVMKEHRTESDQAYKERALTWLGGLGRVVLCADNEPGHCNAMHKAFPDALTVLVDTRHSSPAPPLAEGVQRVPGLTAVVGAPQGGES